MNELGRTPPGVRELKPVEVDAVVLSWVVAPLPGYVN